MPRVPADPSAPPRAAGGTPESVRAPARPRRRSPFDPDHRTTRVVLNALDLLEAFGGGEPEQGVSAIAARLGLPKNNVFRILAAGARLPARTPLTVADPAVLLDRLPVIARKGYAVDDGEYAAALALSERLGYPADR